MKHVVIGIPTPEYVHSDFALANLPQIINVAKKKGYKLSLMSKTGVRTDSNRNQILNTVLKSDADAILWLDADMVYDVDIVDKLYTADKNVIGTTYYKRSYPYYPVVYVKNGNEVNPYSPVDLGDKPEIPLIVDGIGFGGMMVKTSFYRSLGEDMWHRYGDNFQIPTATTKKESHDLVFCQTTQEHGSEVWIHNGCKALHIESRPVGEVEFRRGY